MKKIYLLLSFCFWVALVHSQDTTGIKFDPSIDVNFEDVEEVQVPSSPVKSQVLFIGGYHQAESFDESGNMVTGVTKEQNDFIGITPLVGENGYWITVNQETQEPSATMGDGGGMTSFKVIRDPITDTLKVVESTLPDGRSGMYFNVLFENTVGETWNNCGGIINMDGRIWTAEEYPPSSNERMSHINNGDTLPVVIGKGVVKEKLNPTVEPLFKGEKIERYQNIGWMVEIDPVTAKAVRKQYNWGRMSFEGGAILPDNKTVFLTEDGTPGLLTKFVADEAGDFTSGKLYAYSQTATDDDGKWVEMDNSSLVEMTNLTDSAYNRGATGFIRLEWIVELGGKVYIAETGLDNPSSLIQAIQKGGDVAEHHIARATDQGGTIDEEAINYYDRYGRILVYDPETDELSVYLEGGPYYEESISQEILDYPSKHLSNPDGLGKLIIGEDMYLLVQEDLNGSSYNRVPDEADSRICEMYLLDVSNASPSIDDLVRIYVGPTGAELTGGNGTPDGKSILVDIQHPSSDVFPYTSENGVTVALTGFDQLADITDAEIDADFANTSMPQYSNSLIHQVLFVGGTDKALGRGKDGNKRLAVTKEQNDFIGITPTETEGEYYISVNQETQEPNEVLGDGGGMTVFKVSRDVDDSFIVEEQVKTEDIVQEVMADEEPLFKGEVLQRYENIGWMVEVDPVTAKAVRKQYNWGRMSFEGGAMINDSIVILTEDGTPGILSKFICDVKGDFTKGTLYVYNQYGEGEDGNWVKMDNSNIDEMIQLADRAYAKGATSFIRLEWAVEIGGKVYIAETGLDNPSSLIQSIQKGGNVAQHHYDRADAQEGYIEEDSISYYDRYGRVLVYDPATDSVSVYLEGGPDYGTSASQAIAEYPSKHLSNPDGLGKLIVGEDMYLVIQEDLNGSSYNRVPDEASSRICEMYLLDVSNETPSIEDLMLIYVGPDGAELTGGNGTPDGKSILVDIQHPSSKVFPYTSENGVTVALTGFDQLADITDAEIDADFANTSMPQYSENLIHQVLFRGGTDLATSIAPDGTTSVAVTKEQNDFIGITPTETEGKYHITVNQETQEPNAILGDGGGMTVFTIERKEDDSFVVLPRFEEDAFEDTVASYLDPLFKGEVLDRYQNVGWMVEIDPMNAQAVRKQYNWGRMSFEGGAMINDSIVVLTEDGTPGLLTKFVADVKGDFTSGKLYAYNQNGEGSNWIEMDNTNLYEMTHLADIAYQRGASAFIRLEWAVEVDGKVYIAETGLDNPSSLISAIQKGGNVAKHHYNRAADQSGYITGDSISYYDRYGRILVYDPSVDSVMVYLEGGPDYGTSASQAIAEYPAKHLSNPDGLGKLEVGEDKYLVIQEDLNGSSYNRVPDEASSRICEMYLLDVSIAEPGIDDLIRIYVGPDGAELTGGNGTPDGKSILVDIQHPSSEVAPYTSQNGVTVALTGFDQLEDITDAEVAADFANTSVPQYSENLIHQVLFVGGTDTATTFNAEGVAVFDTTKEQNDFIGITPDGDDYWISINLERQEQDSLMGDGGGMVSFKVERGTDDSLKVVETSTADGRTGFYHNVEFEKTVGETWNNCGGIISSTGRIWTAEEYPPSGNSGYGHINNNDLRPFVIGYGYPAEDAVVTKYVNIDFENTVGETWNNCGGIISSEGRIWTAEEYPPASNGAMDHINNGDTLDFMIGYGTLSSTSTSGKYFNVEFENTVGETWNNCGGIIGPDGRIWTAEEYPPASNAGMDHINNADTLDYAIGIGYLQNNFEGESLEEFEGEEIERYQNIGWMVEIDPANAKAIRKQYNWGRMSFEGGAILEDSIVYLSEDGTPGLFTKFVADKKGDFTEGTLYVYNQEATGEHGKWIMMDNANLDEMINLADSAYKRGATAFIRLEWVVEIGGKIYIAETGLDNPSGLVSALEKGGNIADHHYTRATAQGGSISEAGFNYHDRYGRVLVYDPATDAIEPYLEAGPAYDTQASQSVSGDYPEKHLSNPDGLGKITIKGQDYMLICEDLNGSSYNRVPDEATSRICELYMLDMSTPNPTVADLTRLMVGPEGAELTGANGTPDGKTILVDVQHPSSNTFPYTSEYGVTIALTGFDYIASDDAGITSLEFADLSVAASIDGTEISAEVPFGTDVTSLVPTIVLSFERATVSPASEVAQDFTNPVTYTVTAENGTEKEYTVTIDVAQGSSDALIASFEFESLDVTATIAGENITATVPADTDVSALVATVTLSSADATVSPLSGVAVNYTNPVTFTVTAQDGTVKEYTVTIDIEVGIDDIKNSFGFGIYPNPAVRELYFNGTYSVAIYDESGILIKVKENTDRINISELKSGTYFIKNGNGEVKKLIVE